MENNEGNNKKNNKENNEENNEENKEEILETIYIKKDKPTTASSRSNKKYKNGRDQQESQSNHKNNEEMIRELMKKREEEDLQKVIEKSKSELINPGPSQKEYEEKVKYLNEIFPEMFSNGKLKDALRKHNMDLEKTYEYLANLQSDEKKAQKNQNEGLIRIPQMSPEKRVDSNDQSSSSEQFQRIQKVKETVKDISDFLIVDALEKYNNDVEKAINYILDNPQQEQNYCDLNDIFKQMQDEEKEAERKEEEDIVHFLLNEMTQINAPESELDEIIELKRGFSQDELQNPEIAELIKQSSIYLQQIQLFKQKSEPQEEISDYYDDSEQGQLNYQIDLFLENEIRSQQKNNTFEMKESDFPSIQKKPSNGGPNIIRELQRNSRPFGQQCLQELSTQFPHVNQETLVSIFLELKENYDLTKKFLLSEYGRSNFTQRTITIKRSRSPVSSSPSQPLQLTETQLLEQQKESFEKQFGKISLQDLRQQIQSSTQFNRLYSLAEKSGDTKTKLSLKKHFLNKDGISLDQMKKYFKVLFLLDLRSNLPMNKIDLHGFGKDEALEVLKDQIEYLISAAQEKRFSEITITNNYISLEIITGKGNHSQNGSVLKPLVISFLKRADYQLRVGEGAIFAKIPF